MIRINSNLPITRISHLHITCNRCNFQCFCDLVLSTLTVIQVELWVSEPHLVIQSKTLTDTSCCLQRHLCDGSLWKNDRDSKNQWQSMKNSINRIICVSFSCGQLKRKDLIAVCKDYVCGLTKWENDQDSQNQWESL